MDTRPLFRSAAEQSASERYNDLSLRNQGPYKVIGVNDRISYIQQDGLESTAYIHCATLSLTSRWHCNDKPADADKNCVAEDPYLDEETEEHQEGDHNTYVVDRICRQIGISPRLWYVVRWYGYSNVDDTAQPPTTYLSPSLTRIGVDSTSGEGVNRNASSVNNYSQHLPPAPLIHTVSKTPRTSAVKPCQTGQPLTVLK